eukprot:g12368.t1
MPSSACLRGPRHLEGIALEVGFDQKLDDSTATGWLSYLRINLPHRANCDLKYNTNNDGDNFPGDTSTADTPVPGIRTFGGCAAFCALRNACVGVAFNSNLVQSLETSDACWLKERWGSDQGQTGWMSLRMTDDCRVYWGHSESLTFRKVFGTNEDLEENGWTTSAIEHAQNPVAGTFF